MEPEGSMFVTVSQMRSLFAQDATTCVHGAVAECFFNAKQLVVFSDTVRAAEASGFDLTGVQCDGEIRDGGVFGFTRAVRDHRGILVAVRELDGFDGFEIGRAHVCTPVKWPA